MQDQNSTAAINKPPASVCVVAGCNMPHNARGFCITHYSHWKRAGRPEQFLNHSATKIKHPEICLIPGCGGKPRCNSLCATHHSSWRNYGKPELPDGLIAALNNARNLREAPKPKCSDANCQWVSQCKGMCRSHYNAWYRVNHPRKDDPVLPKRRKGQLWFDGLDEFRCIQCGNIKLLRNDFPYRWRVGSDLVKVKYFLKICRNCQYSRKQAGDKQSPKSKALRSCKGCGTELLVKKTVLCQECALVRFKKRRKCRGIRTQPKWKIIALDRRGWRCERCNLKTDEMAIFDFQRVLSVYEFHHRDPADKNHDLSRSCSLDKFLQEADKCDLLCANCHRYIEFQKRRKSKMKKANLPLLE